MEMSVHDAGEGAIRGLVCSFLVFLMIATAFTGLVGADGPPG